MDCPNCGARLIVFSVPEEYQESVPEDAETAGLCPSCLELVAAPGHNVDARFDRLSTAFPSDDAAAVPLAIALGLLDSLALHRRDIESLLEAVERAGTDPLLVIDRLDVQGGVQPPFDLGRRRHQLQQLID
ncbi:MAG: DUF6276 family protein [Natronomonas sp.]